MKGRYQRLMLGISLTIFLLYGCGPLRQTHVIKKNFAIPTTKVMPASIKVGLYLPSDVCRYKIMIRGGYIFVLGEAICDGIERMFSQVFSDILVLDSRDSDITKYGVKVIIVPEIVDVHILYISGIDPSETIIDIKYTAMDMNILWVDTFQGVGKQKRGWLGDILGGIQLCLEDHFCNALEGSLSSKWWESIK
jgi:hypothetical protein